MEVFMHNIPPSFDEDDVKLALAHHLHGASFGRVQINFAVHLHRPKPGRARTGTFTVADPSIAQKFLQIYGSNFSPQIITIGHNRISFKASNKLPRPEIVALISHMPWINPAEAREQKRKTDILTASKVSISSIQFGWLCRDDVFSIETEVRQPASLIFSSERREMHVTIPDGPYLYTIAIRQAFISSISQHHSTRDGQAVLYLDLRVPPTFLYQVVSNAEESSYYRSSSCPLFDNPEALPFTSLALRLVFASQQESERFSYLAETADMRYIQTYDVLIERRGLFSESRLDLLNRSLRGFSWCVAFQLAALVYNTILDVAELLDLVMPRVRRIISDEGDVYAAKLLTMFRSRAHALLYNEESNETIKACFESTKQEFAKQCDMAPLVPEDGSYYQSLHVTITPTSVLLNGPHPEQSNRIIRQYGTEHQENFLRVSFRDENDLQYRFDRDIKGPDFIKKRIGQFLKYGLTIAGYNFEFLAYSQSALKDHSVWFVKPFCDSNHDNVDAKTIIRGIGSFDNLPYDPTLMRCPARYAARISQAFTATDAAVVEVEEILMISDIKTSDGKYVFTDGVGVMSRDLARAIWNKLRADKQRAKSADFPHAYQIRYRGSKGMLSIDYTLNGSHTIGLRPSMIKFDGGTSGTHQVEIARAFNRPTTYYLNRPLITLLEGLGVKYEVFLDFQNKAVQETNDATETLSKAARLFETHGLGTSFRLPSVMLSLAKLGLGSLHDDPFYAGLLKAAVYHVLRDLKHHARIPIPDAWTLVGIADVHSFLEEGEVFACVKRQNEQIFFLEGPVLVSRSPTIHPGDVQLVHAIGAPPGGSCFASEPLPNTIVFSVKGERPLPSCLGGGDLDGDIYNITPLKVHPWFTPSGTYQPAEYPPTQRKLLDRPSTMNDVADFVMEYIISDVVGIIAINWLIIADQSPDGIKDPDCLTLAQLHSDAVDYPKSGRAVDPATIPKLKFKAKPDWNAPETAKAASNDYYQSQSAIGKLFRAIDLGEPPANSKLRRRGKRKEPRRARELADDLAGLTLSDTVDIVEEQVRRFLDTDGPWDRLSVEHVERLFRRFSTELTGVATNLSLSHKNVMLSEEEVVVGTITQKTSQPRMRKEAMAKVREQTDTIVRGVKRELEGDSTKTLEDYLKHAWLAWMRSFYEAKKDKFGAKSFGWSALGAIFDAMKQIEEHDAAELRSVRSRRG